MTIKEIMKVSILITVISLLVFNACSPLREFGKSPVYQGTNNYDYKLPAYDSLKKTIVIVANNGGTELFDLIAPYYLFNATGKANVYIVAKNKQPVVVKKGFFLLPQFTFNEIDSLSIKPAAIVIPFLSAADSAQQDPVIINWIRKHYSAQVDVLSVCDGSATAAATGIFDGKPITAHASDFAGIKVQFTKPLWVQHVSVANEGNLYSTAGVSNAVEGSLMVINKLFGGEIMKQVSEGINYPYPSPKTTHQSSTFTFRDKVSVGTKIIFKGNKKLGVLLKDGINEFELAAIMDTYNRTFPKSIESFTVNDLAVRSKYGLTLIPTGSFGSANLDELHIINPLSLSETDESLFKSAKIVSYRSFQKQYIIDQCLLRIKAEYGQSFVKVVKLMLDYN